MKVLVIGGTGFTGPHIVTRLSDLGHEVTVFHRGRTETSLPKTVRHIYCPSGVLGNRTYFHDFRSEFKGIAPDLVLDMIPVTEQDAKTTIDLFRGIARRIVVISSQDVYWSYGALIGIEQGPPLSAPITEDAPLRERLYPYRSDPPKENDDPMRWMDDYDKILVERAVLGDPDLPGTVLRLPMVYGPNDKQHRMFENLRRMQDRRPAILLEAGLARWRWTRGYVENIADAVVLAVLNDQSKGRVYNVGEPDALSMVEWIGHIGKAMDWDGEVLEASRDILPDKLQEKMNTEHDLVTDSTLIRDELGYKEAVPRDEAIARTVAWERDNPPDGSAENRPDYAAEDEVLAKLGRG